VFFITGNGTPVSVKNTAAFLQQAENTSLVMAD
jgi:hypothetical protein